MTEMPVFIGNEYNIFPILDKTPIIFRLPTNIGDFQNLIELTDILSDLSGIFRSRFSFMRFNYFISRKDCKTLNDLELALIHTTTKESLSSYIKPPSEADEVQKEIRERLHIPEVYNLRETLINILFKDSKIAYDDIEFQNLSDCTPYNNLYKIFSQNFTFVYQTKDLLRMMDLEHSKLNVDFSFSEEEMIKALLLSALFLINPREILKDVPILNNLEKIKIDLIREELVLKESDEEIKKMFEEGQFDWFEGELLNRSKVRVIREIKQFLAKAYRSLTDEMIVKKDKILNINKLKSRWRDIPKTRFKEVSSKKNIYNLVLDTKLKPVVYILDENLYSISIGKYALQFYENSKSSQKLDKSVYSTLNKLESLLTTNYYWAKNQDLEIKIFDKNGQIYKEFKNKEEFLFDFNVNNKTLETYYQRIKENDMLINLLFTGKEEYSSDEIKTIINFSKRLFKYLTNNGDKSSLLKFPDLDLELNSSSIITLFETLIEKQDAIGKGYSNYNKLIKLFFEILLRNYIQGRKWFNLTGTGFKEEEYVGKIASLLEKRIGKEELLKIIVSIIKINTRIVDKKIIRRVYIWKYGFIFNTLNTEIDSIINIIFDLIKRVK